MTIDDYRNERLRKLDEIKGLGIDPYPAKSHRDTKIRTIITDFDAMNEKVVTIAGRIAAIRSFGKLAFIKVKDDSGEVQIFMTQAEIENDKNFDTKRLKLLDSGDFIEATGKVG